MTVNLIKPPPVDLWEPGAGDVTYFYSSDNGIVIPLSALFKITDDPTFDQFILSPKKCYKNKENIISHISKYLNYFENFYDTGHTLIWALVKIKASIDLMPYSQFYDLDLLKNDIYNLILNPDGDIFKLITQMNEDNYIDHISKKQYNNSNAALKYNDAHIKELMRVSLLQLIIIPIIVHYCYRKNITNNIDHIILQVFHMIFETNKEIDIMRKLMETVFHATISNYKSNQILWDKLQIEGKTIESHVIEILNSIVIQIIPKYKYDQNIVSLNTVVINRMNEYKIERTKFEMRYISIDYDQKDDDSNSELDKFESSLAKKNESIILHNQVNYESTMDVIERLFGPFNSDEIDYYLKELSRDAKTPINEKQKNLIFLLFYKYFGDTIALKEITLTGYIKLIIAAKKILRDNNLPLMEAILTGKFVKDINRININKKDLAKIKSSYMFEMVERKYKNQSTINYLLALLATITASKFQFISYEHQELTGKPIVIHQDSLNAEFLSYVVALI